MGSTAWARTRPRNSPCRPPTAPPTNATAQVIHLDHLGHFLLIGRLYGAPTDDRQTPCTGRVRELFQEYSGKARPARSRLAPGGPNPRPVEPGGTVGRNGPPRCAIRCRRIVCVRISRSVGSAAGPGCADKTFGTRAAQGGTCCAGTAATTPAAFHQTVRSVRT